MPVTPTYPGVYIQEIPSGVRTIVGVPTSVGAFIGYFKKGPLNSPVKVFNPGDFEREFGGLRGLNKHSEASYAIGQFFLNGGGQAWVVRTLKATTFATASVVLQDGAGGGVLRAKAGRRVGASYVEDPGTWGNHLRVDIDYDVDPALPDAANRFNLTVSEIDADELAKNKREVVVATETYRTLTMDDQDPLYALEVVNDGSSRIQLDRLTAIGTNTRPAQTGTVGGDASPTGTDALANIVAAAPPAATNFPFTVNVNGTARSGDFDVTTATPTYQMLRSLLQSAIRKAGAAGGGLAEEPMLTGATVQTYNNSFRVLAGRGGANYDPETLITFAENGASTVQDLGLLGVGGNVQQYKVGSTNAVGAQGAGTTGSEGTLPGDLPDAAALQGTQAGKDGIFALEDVDFNLLCIPRAASLATSAMQAVYSTAVSYCEDRRAFLIIDLPSSTNTLPDALDWLTDNANLQHENAAAYFPRPKIPDPLNEYRLKSVGASGTMAGVYARTDTERGVWKAPAGIEASLRNVSDLDYPLTDPENGELNPRGLNCLRNFDVFGNVVWGARTLAGADRKASEWKYLPVRRLALFIEESLYRGTQWVVFEPNDEPLWAQIRLNVGAFMHNLFRQGAFQGTSPRDAYLVKCDSETTTQNDIDLGIVNILVGFAPLKPAEFVIISIKQLAGQVQA